MAESSEADVLVPGRDAGIYVDSSAVAKLYVPEAESDALDAFLRGRVGLAISELAVTEVLSAVARRKRERELSASHANRIRDALLTDVGSGSFARLDLTPAIHREAERLLLSTDAALRTLDALHLALAFSGRVNHVLTFDRRMAQAAAVLGFNVIDLRA